MLTSTGAFSGLGVDSLAAAKEFYGGKLGLTVDENPAGLTLRLPGGGTLFVYESPSFTPAGYTALNFEVADITAAAAELQAAGVELERYEGLPHDESGIVRGKAVGQGPDIGWFRDPSGNIISILQS
ncbi:VOC family protein [Gryllotalpicola protaetiae]|uniref:VOC family protein n=1 Tax=Gryllotalpicola protaetiae TaxID=2419771 RepID=A0A387C0B2_9MICO|nr:VOC family protein [Gryllotalpicola protaetiae]AYG03991.1 VOC family protein [Gryllotalpicola protaetiae]